MKKNWSIEGKGYFNGSVANPFNINLKISDIKCGYGYIEFTGSKKELDKFIDKLLDNEETFKYINHHEEGEDEGMFFNGINFKELMS